MTYIFLSVYQIVFGEKSYILLYSFCKIHKYMYERKLDFFSEFIRALDFLHLQN